jgi:ankyrin repeat protein
MLSIPAWLIVLIPLSLLTIGLWFAVHYIRRGTGTIHRAVSRGNIDRVRQLLLADPRAAVKTDLVGYTPLQYAAFWGHCHVASLLLKNGAQHESENGWTPLHYAAGEGRLKMIELLLEKGAAIDAHSTGDGSTPLHSAVIKKQGAAVRLLLEKGADLNTKTKSDWTAAHFAANAGSTSIMRNLIEAGADWQLANAAGETPIQLAISNNRTDIVTVVETYIEKNDADSDAD